jgi:uncharacterized membrane protein (UPF0136 family)
MGPPGSAHMNLAVGSMVVLGGVTGYVRKGSTISLVAGVTVGSLLLGSGYMISKTNNIFEGHLLATGAAGVLTVAMSRRFMMTRKFMPSGLAASIGIITCAYNAKKAQEWAPW